MSTFITLAHKKKCLEKVAKETAKTEAVKTMNRKSKAVKKSTGKSRDQYDLILANLNKHRDQLKALHDINEKIELKKAIVPEYLEYLKQYEETGQRYQNSVMPQLVIWLFDIGDIETALHYTKLSISLGLDSPANMKRNLDTFAADFIGNWAIDQHKADASAAPYIFELAELLRDNQFEVDVAKVQSMVLKEAAKEAERSSDWESAVAWYQLAVERNPEGHGCKTALAEAEKKLAKASE